MLLRRANVLTTLNVEALTMNEFFASVSTCPLLKELSVEFFHKHGSKPDLLSPTWTCTGLRKLELRLYYGASGDLCSIDEAMPMARSFMKQLGTMSMLEDLD
ncbi:hypothetical protein MVEG_07215 [Podila verticillata NRRL 6337]|nr:hypothetical protein MVEG_07215 [Podila verticillata NRRL 6337]